MKRWLKFMFVIMLIIPFTVSAVSDQESEVVGQTIKYFKTVTIFNNSGVMRDANLGEMSSLTTEVTKEEFDNAEPTTSAVAPLSSARAISVGTETTYKRLTTTISKVGSYYDYTATLYWKNMPAVRSYDIIGIGHYSSVELEDPNYIYFDMSYCRSSSSCYHSYTATEVIGNYGTGVLFKLPANTIISLEQTLNFTVKKSISGTVTSQTAAGDYAHATRTILPTTIADKFVVNSLGLSIDSTIQDLYYDTTPAAIVEWTGTW